MRRLSITDNNSCFACPAACPSANLLYWSKKLLVESSCAFLMLSNCTYRVTLMTATTIIRLIKTEIRIRVGTDCRLYAYLIFSIYYLWLIKIWNCWPLFFLFKHSILLSICWTIAHQHARSTFLCSKLKCGFELLQFLSAIFWADLQEGDVERGNWFVLDVIGGIGFGLWWNTPVK